MSGQPNAPRDVSLFPTCRKCGAFLGTFTTPVEKARKVIALMFCDQACRDSWAKERAGK